MPDFALNHNSTTAAVLPEAFAEGPEPIAAAAFRYLAELAFLGVLYQMLTSQAAINGQIRLMLVILGISLPLIGWAIYSRRLQAASWRLWLVFAAGYSLSLAVTKNLASLPGPLAEHASIAMGAAGILSAALSVALSQRRTFPWTGCESAWAAAVVVIIGSLLWLFHSVAAQNGLDSEVVLTPVRRCLIDYSLVLAGMVVISSRRDSFARAAIILGLALLVRTVLHHAGVA